jgi:DNA invertase Pin-like site-specific DNA recombinase
MARKSRVNISEPAPVAQAVYNTGIYARLSAEDTDCDSIDSQILLIENGIKNDPQIKIIERYTDNGLTGRTFEREGFQRMMDDIKAQKINCIAVKDLSRFARNYIEASEYLEKIFPFMGIRFLSVNDGFDSNRDDPTDIIIMLKNLVNHEYAQDLSRKITAVFSTKRKNGEFLGTNAPYGYKRSETHKNKLEICEETAPVIRDIFKWKSEGISHNHISRRLNEMGVPSPAKRLRDKGALTTDMNIVTSLWSTKTVSEMLKNSVYIGRLTQGRRKQMIRDGKLVEVIAPESEWDIVENAHPAIINMDLWNFVQAVMGKRRENYFAMQSEASRSEKQESAYKGLVICGLCGSRMCRQKNVSSDGNLAYRYFCYVRRQQSIQSCETKTVSELTLHNIVHKIISEEIQRTVDIKTVIEDLNKDSDKEKAEISKQIAAKNKRLGSLRVLRMSLVESLAVKRISESDFINAKSSYEAEETQLKQDMEMLEVRLNDETMTMKNRWLTSFQRFMNEKTVTREMAVTLIQKIVVYDNNHIDVYLNFRSDYEKLIEHIGEVEAI